MGGRTLPTECSHGVTVDWGDFGCDEYHDEGCSTCNPRCEQCDQEWVERRAHWLLLNRAEVEAGLSSVPGVDEALAARILAFLVGRDRRITEV